jgi:hypothetical protein
MLAGGQLMLAGWLFYSMLAVCRPMLAVCRPMLVICRSIEQLPNFVEAAINHYKV